MWKISPSPEFDPQTVQPITNDYIYIFASLVIWCESHYIPSSSQKTSFQTAVLLVLVELPFALLCIIIL